MKNREISTEEREYLEAVDVAIKRAGVIMDMEDVEDDCEDFDSVYESRFHCGTCVVRTVLEEIWPDLNNLMDFYEQKSFKKPFRQRVRERFAKP